MGIGTLNEGPLHAALKAHYLRGGGESEVTIGDFVADVVTRGVTFEIQTGSFSGLKRKMNALADRGPVVLVFPVAEHKTIIKLPIDREQEPSRRGSPKRGHVVDVVSELVYLPGLLANENFSVEVVLINEEELREYDPKKVRRRRGWRVLERRLLEIKEQHRLNRARDLCGLLRHDLAEPFTISELAVALEQPLHAAQKMAYCLRHACETEICGSGATHFCTAITLADCQRNTSRAKHEQIQNQG